MAACGAFQTVYIASPNAFHFEQALFFLRHGKHVLCEKPLTTTKEESARLFEEAERRGLTVAEAIMSIHTPAFETLKTEMGTLGRIRSVRLDFCQLSSKYPAYLRGERQNIFDPAMHAGCLMDIGVYNVYLATALFGKPQRILSAATFLPSGADSAGAAILTYPDLTVSLSYSKVGQQFAPSEIVGDEGTLEIGSVSQLTGLTRMGKGQAPKILVPDDLSRDEVMGAEARFFAETVQNGKGDRYYFAKETCLTVREIMDEIRRQNGFPF